MLRSIDSTPDTHHVRHLLDQRVNRLDPDDNFCGLTQYTDTPSVYASTYFSPNLRPPHDGSYSPRDRLNDPNMSSLDMDDEPRFSLAISQSDTTTNDDDDSHSFEDDDDTGHRQGEDTDGRLSYLGPKMRFHSRAPWEMEGDIPEEEEDAIDSPKHHGFPFSFGGGGKGNHSTGSSSPRPSFGRPSADSNRSHLMPKRSFDTINSQMSSKGALYALAQESLSSASLAKPNPPPQKDSLFGKLSSLGRARGNSSPSSPVLLPTRSRANSRVPPIHHDPLDSVPQADYDPFAANQSHYMGRASRPQSPGMDEVVHPYANPDALPDRNSSYSTSLQLHPSSRNDSSITVTQKFDLGSPTPSRNSVTSSIATGKHRVSSIHGREISSPVAIQGTSLPPEMSGFDQAGGVSHLPGWKEKFVPPAFNLISLEEARALRAKPQPQPPADDSTPMQSVADLLSHPTSMQTSTEETLSTFYQDPSPNGRTRGRTISTGAKAKNAFQSMVGSVVTDSRRESEPSITPTRPAPVSQLPSKPLKHKKSGFMRLFNGGLKDKEADEMPPPVPSASNASDVASLSARRVISRVPVPSYSQPPSGSASPQDPTFCAKGTTNQPSPTKRGPPTLSIDTVSSNSQNRAMPDQRYQQRTTSSLYAPKPWSGGDQPPASAPPDMTGFPALRLRPVSSLFSSGFEHIVPDLATSSGFDTPTSFSPTGPLSPITPGKVDRFSKSDIVGPSTTPSSQLALSQRRITELEDQVRSLKTELELMRSRQHDLTGPYCGSCGRGNISSGPRNGSLSSNSSSSSSGGSGGIGYTSVINRPRAKTSTTSRFVNALA